MSKILLNETCKKCGACCKNYPFIELSKNEISTLWQLTKLHSDVFTYQKDKIAEEYFLQFKENGDCFFLIEDNGCYSCSIYESRPGICKNYPSNPRQEETCDANRGKSQFGGPLKKL